ncbi:MAG: 23S rRNA (uracil(1939)-C(5))-methyltransferase RlmD [Clostridia bacterium]|nr:23S rRNA (uracil(1939)-C(5))-methyltransferase RlmD [Clostridia bacterium]
MSSQNKKSKANGCPVYKKCGGCQLQNLSYDMQLKHKQVKCIKLLGRAGHVDEIIGMDDPYHYRCKVQSAFTTIRGNVVSGVYQSSTHRIVPVDNCMLEDKAASEIILTLRKLIKSFKIKTYNMENGTGFFRHVLIRRGFYTGQVMVVLVTADEQFPSVTSFVNALVGRHPEITTVVQNVSKKSVNLVLGEKNIVLHGDGYIEDTIDGCRFRISPKSFYQVNPQMTTLLYAKAIEFMGLTGSETVIDAYCGTGTIGILASRNAGKVIGVELNKDAVRDAKENARLNNCDNIEFFAGDAGEFMVEMASKGKKADVVIMDPPRAGSDVKFMRSVVKLNPERVVYVSCNPETLSHDLTYFGQNGYAAKKIQPFDMFPHTGHCECVVMLSREKADDYARVSVKTKDLKTK